MNERLRDNHERVTTMRHTAQSIGVTDLVLRAYQSPTAVAKDELLLKALPLLGATVESAEHVESTSGDQPAIPMGTYWGYVFSVFEQRRTAAPSSWVAIATPSDDPIDQCYAPKDAPTHPFTTRGCCAAEAIWKAVNTLHHFRR
jgi:hypothetical protein